MVEFTLGKSQSETEVDRHNWPLKFYLYVWYSSIKHRTDRIFIIFFPSKKVIIYIVLKIGKKCGWLRKKCSWLLKCLYTFNMPV